MPNRRCFLIFLDDHRCKSIKWFIPICQETKAWVLLQTSEDREHWPGMVAINFIANEIKSVDREIGSALGSQRDARSSAARSFQ